MLADVECVVIQTSSLSSDMVGIPTADEFMKHKDEFDAKIDNASDELNAGQLSACCCHLSTSLYFVDHVEHYRRLWF